jgi:hypothetical protein
VSIEKVLHAPKDQARSWVWVRDAEVHDDFGRLSYGFK